ncbi:MAG: type II toxin-antitoxin system Phd/YefM family antitoxin [Lachnospiraceae bacterium]|nr:type II toxin-antitoxin system Phd/YefM family antitoxin [Lachnospiraceae bacterium]
MIAVKGTTVKNDFKSICSRVYAGEVFVISRPKNENVVMISERDYNELEKMRKNLEYLTKIDRAVAQRNAGTMQEHDLIED